MSVNFNLAKNAKRLSCLILCTILLCFSFSMNASAEGSNTYGNYASFNELYDAYIQAVNSGDTQAQAELLAIAQDTLDEEIANSNTLPTLERVDPDWQYYNSLFPTYFSSGYWETRADGLCLTLNPINAPQWSSQAKDLAWNATYARFGYNGGSNWPNNKTAIMREQFYCHARLVYSSIETVWNLEPWRTSMNPITCN